MSLSSLYVSCNQEVGTMQFPHVRVKPWKAVILLKR